MGLVGIVANPASGKDIRRLVAHGSTFDNAEKANIVRRVLLGLAAVGVERVLYMPDTHAIVARALDAAGVAERMAVEALPMPTTGDAGDSLEAARRLADLGAGCIVTLGGDGTNRVVAKGCGEVPLVPISTGTNNVFPRMVEGTLAGLAAGLVATGAVSGAGVMRRAPRLDVRVDGQVKDLALIDVVTARRSWVGARALWEPEHVGEVVLSRVRAGEIGMCALGGVLFPEAPKGTVGAHVIVAGAGEAAAREVVAPLAPGLIRTVRVAGARLVGVEETIRFRRGRCTVALDGEREFELPRGDERLEVVLNPAGPWVVDVEGALRAGAARGLFERGAGRS